MSVLQQLASLSRSCEISTGIPKEVTAAQAILEAGWNLESTFGNNCFGIKAGQGIGSGKQLLRTKEWLDEAQLRRFLAGRQGRTAEPLQPLQLDSQNRTLYRVKDWFATFATLEDCFAYRAKLLLKIPYYRDATAKFKAISHPAPADIAAYVDAIAKHYSTSEDYADQVKKLAFGPALTRAFDAV